jgi:hypothetical protein
MSIAHNQYASRAYAEHPIAMWPLDEQAYYLSLINDSNRLFSTWTITGCTASDSPTIPSTPSPFDSTIYTSVIKSTTASGTIEMESPALFNATNVTADITTFCVNFFMYQKPTYINWFKVGYRYNNSGGTPQEVLSAAIPPPTTESWVNFNNVYDIPTSWSGSLKIVIQVNFLSSVSGDASSRTLIMNGLSIGQGSDTTCYESLGSTTVTLPSAFGFTGMTGISADQYGVLSDNGYYLVRNNKLLAKNDGLPIIYGTDHSTKLYGSDVGYPSLVFPGKGMLHEEGRNKEYTLEMWIKLNPASATSLKIAGPIDSNDGIYVKEGFLTLSIGKEVGSYCVTEWYRPMLIHLSLRGSNALLMVNGEEVVNISLSRSSIDLPNGNDWWGAYSYTSIPVFEIDCISIYPYIVSSSVAKRRFVYGLGTPSAQSIDTSFQGVPTAIDFATSEHDAGIIYPDIARWDAGNFSNLNATSKSLSVPDYKLPLIYLGGVDENKWYDDNRIANNLSYVGEHPKFVSFRPNITYTGDTPTAWSSTGISYTGESYFNFSNVNMLNNSLAGAYGVFQIDSSIASDRPLMVFINTITSQKFSILVNGTTVKYLLGDTLLDSHTATVGTEFLIGLNFSLASTAFGYAVSQFFSSPSSIQLYVGGDGLTTFEGRIFTVGFINEDLFPEVSDNFNVSGLAIIGNFEIMLNYIASYTLIPEYEYGQFFLDISVSAEWEEYFPLSYFASYIRDLNGDYKYALDMLQINLGYTSVESTAVWTYADLKTEFSAGTYNSIRTGVYSNYFNLMKRNESTSTINVSNSSLQGYLTFQTIASGANAPLSSFEFTAGLAADLVIIPSAENTGLIPNKEYLTKFSFKDNVIIYPTTTNFEDYAMVVHLVINQRSIIKNPLKIRSLEIVAKNFNEQPINRTFTQPTTVGTKFGKKLYSSSMVLGGESQSFDTPFTIYKTSTPYLYTTGKSGIRVLGESVWDSDTSIQNRIAIPVNDSASFNYKVGAIQFLVKPDFIFGVDSIKFLEIAHKGGVLSYVLDKHGDEATISTYTKPDGFILDGSTPSTVHTQTANGDGTNLVPEGYVDAGFWGASQASSFVYTAKTGSQFYQNGRYVQTPRIKSGEWNMIGIVLPDELDFGEYSYGEISIFGGTMINNLSYYLADGLGIQSDIATRTWQGVYDVDGTVPAGTTWSHWSGGTWQDVYVLGQTSSYITTPSDIYDTYVGTNGFVVDDGYGMLLQQPQAKVVTGAAWSTFSEKPA